MMIGVNQLLTHFYGEKRSDTSKREKSDDGWLNFHVVGRSNFSQLRVESVRKRTRV